MSPCTANSGSFGKGNVPWNKGLKLDPENYPKYGMRGKKHSEESKIKMSDGQERRFKTEDPWNKGKKIDYDKYPNFGMKGKFHTEESKIKVSESRKGYSSWNKGLTKETDERMLRASKSMSVAKKRNWNDPEYLQHMSNAHLGKWGEHPEDFGERVMAGKKTWAEIHQGMAEKNMAKFREQGFRVIPVDLRGHPKPDFIIMKEGKVYAVEIEVKSPPASKFDKWNNFPFFDDIIWIIREEEKQ